MQQSSSGGASSATVGGLNQQGCGGYHWGGGRGGRGGHGGPQRGMMEAPPNHGANAIDGHEVAQNGRDGPPSEPTNGGDRGPPIHGAAPNERDGPPTSTRPSAAPPGIQNEMVNVCLKFIKLINSSLF